MLGLVLVNYNVVCVARAIIYFPTFIHREG